jgi:prolipoprotein diacylglyceryltransferase
VVCPQDLGGLGGTAGGLPQRACRGLWYCRQHGIAAGPYADAVVPGLLLGQALGRFGDFLVGGEYAIPTTVPSAVTFTGLTLPYEGKFNMITIKGGGTERTATG